ncbi:hypothetical protein UlMin_023609 [Ulmus minor]
MASVSQLNQFPYKSFSITPLQSQSRPLLPASSVRISSRFTEGERILTREFARVNPIFRVQVTNDDKWGLEKYEPKLVEPEEIAKLKMELVDSFYRTDCGLKASSETREDIVELITQLEAQNPNPVSIEALSLLNGKWVLLHIFSRLFPLLSRGTLPLVKVEEISQTINSDNFTVQNSGKYNHTWWVFKVVHYYSTVNARLGYLSFNELMKSKLLYSMTLDFLFLIICMVSMTNDHHRFFVSDSWLLTPLGNL